MYGRELELFSREKLGKMEAGSLGLFLFWSLRAEASPTAERAGQAIRNYMLQVVS